MKTLKNAWRALAERAGALTVGWSLAAVAATTGFISYTHICALTVHETQSWKNAHLYPIAVDGQIAIGSVILMKGKGGWRWLGLLGLAPGLGESLIANWASGWSGHNYGAALWATVPAQAFACSMFLFELWLRHRGQQAPAAAPAAEAASLMAQLGYAPLAAPAAVLPAPEPAPEAVAVKTDPATAAAALVHMLGFPPPAGPAPLDLRALVPAGPAMTLAPRPSRAAAPRASRPRAVPGDDPRRPLPSGAELAALLATASRNEIYRTYRVSKDRASKLLAARRDGALEEMSEYAA